MSKVVLVGHDAVVTHRKVIDEVFAKLTGAIQKFDSELFQSSAASRITIPVAARMKFFHEFYEVSQVHPTINAEFMRLLSVWAREVLVPAYRAQMARATAAGDEELVFNGVSRNFQCFSTSTRVTALLFNVPDAQLQQLDRKEPIPLARDVMFKAYREQFYDNIKIVVRRVFFKRLALVREVDDTSQALQLRPIAELFFNVARATTDISYAAVYINDYVAGYIESMVRDNRAKVNEMLSQQIAANDIAAWLSLRAGFEQRLLTLLVASDHDLHESIIKKYDEQVIAPCTKDLITHAQYGFAACFRNGDRSVESFRAAIDLFEISARIEAQHPTCAQECVKVFRQGTTERLKRVLTQDRDHVYKNVNAHATSFVRQLMEEVHALDAVIRRMRNHHELQRSMKDAFVGVLNNEDPELEIRRSLQRGTAVDCRKAHFAEILALFVDVTLRGDDKGAGIAAASFVSDFGILFSFVTDKDVFGEYYKLRLAKRLLLTKCSEDAEAQLLSQMQAQCGKTFTHKYEGMINDLRNAHAIQQQFKAAAGLADVEANVTVLTMAFWPTVTPDDAFQEPESLRTCQLAFERVYRHAYPTEQLGWQSERGSAVLDVAFPKGTKEVACFMNQAAVLIAIDALSSVRSGAGVGLSELSHRVGIDLGELKPIVATMLLAKGFNLLRRVGVDAASKLLDTNLLELNPDYASKIKKLKLPTAVTARSQESDTVKEESIDASRGQMLDAAIIRIMKSRKTAKQAQLIDLTIQAVQRFFMPQPRMIKKRIEELMSKEFLERDTKEPDLFKYLA